MCFPVRLILFSSLVFIASGNSSDHANITIAFVIFSQPNKYHDSLADAKKANLKSQAEKLNSVNAEVFKSHEDLGSVPGHWTVLPLFEKLTKVFDGHWVFFLEERTEIDLIQMKNILSSYNPAKDVFVGHALKDNDPTIIHHFDSSSLLYPHFSAGFFISCHLMKKSIKPCEECQFSIDPKYELSKFFLKVAGAKLIHEPRLCLKKSSTSCASWMETDFPDCGPPVPSLKVQVAVKTCHKYHEDRVKVVKDTWAPDVDNLLFFSDQWDESIPTVKVNVKNVKAGHCQKTLEIMSHYSSVRLDWLVIVDDDTLLNFERLRKLLACYDPAEDVALGERYGTMVHDPYGYDYPTGGSGMVFSRRTLNRLVAECQCPKKNSPDDMIIGVCLKTLGVPVTHSPLMHQARPMDYSPDFLSPVKHVSFHKHWMMEPRKEYKKWLKTPQRPDHGEL